GRRARGGRVTARTRRFVVLLLCVVFAGCGSNPPSANPAGPTLTPTGAPTPTGSPGVSTVPSVSPSGGEAPVASLRWTDCGGGFECGDLHVPLDYANPSAGTLVIAVIRLRATDSAHRIGSLVVNPGGPGASGVEF